MKLAAGVRFAHAALVAALAAGCGSRSLDANTTGTGGRDGGVLQVDGFIVDPNRNIDWVPPEGGGGPKYSNM